MRVQIETQWAGLWHDPWDSLPGGKVWFLDFLNQTISFVLWRVFETMMI